MSTQIIALQQHSINMKNFSVVSQRLLVINTERVYFQNTPNSSDISIIYISRYSLCKLLCILVARALGLAMGYSIFYPYRGMEGKFQGGAPETFSKGVRARSKEGSYKLGQAFQWDHTWKTVFLWAIFGITPLKFQPKSKFRKLPSIPLYGLKMG